MGKLKLKKTDDVPKQASEPEAQTSEPIVMSHFNAARESREAQNKPKSAMRVWLKLALVAIVIAGGVMGAKYFGGGSKSARIESMVAAGGPALGHPPSVWVSFQFMSLPEKGDPKDVRIVFKSGCMKRDLTFDWADIAADPFVRPSKDSVKKKRAEGISPNKEPKLNYVFDTKLNFPIDSLRPTVDLGTRLRLTAELYWAGEKVHSKSCSIDNWYVVQ